MRKNGKAVPGGCSTEDGSGQMSFGGLDLSEADCTIEYQPTQGTIASVLSRGRENALTCREIGRITELTRRQITLRIYDERRRGAPILSDTSGFWLAESVDEIRRCVSSLHSRAGEIHSTARALERILKQSIPIP